MNTEKIEKLKKSLSNSKIPADLKPKIEAEIKRLESLDALATEKAKEEKEEAKEEAKPVAKTRKPRAKKTTTAKPSQTSKPKRTAMSVAKEIRKEGESWKDAQARASKMMKEDSKDLSKTVETELDKLSKLVRSQKQRAKLSGLSGTDIKRDAVRKAKPRGARRVTNSGETTNQYGTYSNKLGRKYTENRDNRTDRLAPKYPKNAPLLAEGGYLTDPNFGTFQNQVLATGGSVTNERRYVNKNEDYEVRYSKPILRRKGYQGKRDFELGGVMATDLAGHTSGGDAGFNAGMPLDGFSNTSYTGLVGETGAMSSGEMFMNGGGLPSGSEQSYMITEALGNPAQHYARGGGVRRVGNREYSYGRNWTNDHRHVNKGEDHEVNYTRKGKFLGVFNDGGMMNDGNYAVFSNKRNEIIADGFKTENEAKVFMYDYNLKNPDFSLSIKKLNKGGALTNERKHVNHDEDYEVRYAKPRPKRKGYKGARKFMAGGSMETPRIYVADLEAYNNGRLVGEWLDLSDYNDADELMDAIQDVLKKSGGEEYAIHDYENFPSNLYSEYMSRNDFQALYDVMETAKRNDLPLEVVQDIVSQYGEGGVEEFQGKYDNAEDFAQQLVDDIGIESFNDFQYYLDISDTDRRLLSQEMADSYVDDIRDEDGGNRLIEEAGMDVLEYQEADSQTQEEMLDNAREIVYDEYFDNWYEGLSDPYYFLVEEQGMYSPDDFAKANFVRVDYEKLGDALEQDYTFIEYDGDLYVFNIR